MQKMSLGSIKNGYDIVVVGGGASGCSFLYHLNGQIYSVLLVDYRSFPRRKACSGILVNQGKEFLQSMPKPKGIFAKPKNLDFIYEDWDSNLQKKVKKGFINTYRYKLDNWLFDLLKTKDAQFLENTKLVDFSFTKDKKFIILFLESNGEIRTILTRYLVGCDGAMSAVRKKMSNRQIPMYVAIQETIPGFKIKEAHFIFDKEVTDFYSWLIPKDNAVEIGSAVSPFKAKEKFDLFKQKVFEKTGITGKGVLESAIVLRPSSVSDFFLGKNNVFLCGEAAALITPSAAEGISNALRSGKFCAEAFNENPKNPFPLYAKKTSVIIKRLSEKLEKSTLISHKEKRKKLIIGV